MEITSELTASLRNYFSWNKARLDCFTKMIIALLTVKTVNLVEWSLVFDSEAKPESSYTRIKRFFREFPLRPDDIIQLLISWFGLKEKRWYFSLDRTQWELGKKKINYLVLAINFKNIAIPIYWKLLAKKGNSNTKERIEVIEWLLQHFKRNQIKGLLADREFIGQKWMKYLVDNKIPFYIRIKSNHVIKQGKKQTNAWLLFINPNKMTPKYYPESMEVFGVRVFLSGMRSLDGDFLIIASSRYDENALDVYAKRWDIENLFQCLKGRGFQFEDTRITEPEKLSKLMSVLTIAFAAAYKLGLWKHKEVSPIKLKKHGRPSCSFFRYGLDTIRSLIFNAKDSLTVKITQIVKTLFEWVPPCSDINFKQLSP